MRLFLLFFMVCSAVSAGPSHQLQSFDQIVKIMRENYFDTTYSNSNFLARTAELRDKVDTMSRQEFSNEINDLLGSLGKSHLQLMSHSDTKGPKTSLRKGSLKERVFRLEPVDDGWYITWVKAGEEKLKKGMRVKELDGYPVDDLCGEQHRRIMLMGVLDFWPKGRVVVTTDEGRKVKVKLPKASYGMENFGLAGGPSYLESRLLEGDILYLHFTLFLPQITRSAIAEIQKYKDQVRGVIIDLRNNAGGVAFMSCALARQFSSDGSYSLGTQKMRDSTLRFPVFSGKDSYKGALVFLVNEESYSTAEILPAGMQEIGRAKVFGEKTGGLVLPSVIVQLKNGSSFQYPVADFKTPDGITLEGRGCRVDVEVSHTVAALRQGIDLPLKAASEFILKPKTNGGK